MKPKTSCISVTDQFCGAGGSSLGATAAGLDVKLAMNHWKLAIETHATNFPKTEHVMAEMSAVDPRHYPSTDILITSPECTSHSLAKGKVRKNLAQLDLFGNHRIDPAEERSRATMWDVPRFAEVHNYNLIIVENVVDARRWILFDAWLNTMHVLGYDHQAVYFNSQFAHPTPQSRDRMYIVFWKRGNRAPNLDIRPKAFCPQCGHDVEAVQLWKNGKRWGKYKAQYVYACPQGHGEVRPYYHAAFNVIDWSSQGQRIGDRKQPLKPKTMERIQKGLDKFGKQALLLQVDYSKSNGNLARPFTDPFMTQTTRQVAAMVTPFLVRHYSPGVSSPVTDPTGTVTAQDHHSLLVPTPFLTSYYSRDDAQSELTDPIPTVTTEPRHALVQPYAFLSSYYGTDNNHAITDPVPTITTLDRHALVQSMQPAFISSFYRSDNSHAITDAIPTVLTVNHHALVEAPTPQLEDCYFRMLTPAEIGRAMAFPDDYIVLGTQRDKIRQLGNAVNPPVMSMLIERCVESLQ